MQSLKWPIGSKIRLKWTVPWFSVFVDQKNLKIIWKFSLSQYRCHITPIDVENCVKSALNSNHIKQNFMVITIWGGGDYQLRSALAAKQIWVAVITIWGTLDSLPPSTKQPDISPDLIQHHEDDLFIELKEISGIAATTKSKQYLPKVVLKLNLGLEPNRTR